MLGESTVLLSDVQVVTLLCSIQRLPQLTNRAALAQEPFAPTGEQEDVKLRSGGGDTGSHLERRNMQESSTSLQSPRSWFIAIELPALVIVFGIVAACAALGKEAQE